MRWDSLLLFINLHLCSRSWGSKKISRTQHRQNSIILTSNQKNYNQQALSNHTHAKYRLWGNEIKSLRVYSKSQRNKKKISNKIKAGSSESNIKSYSLELFVFEGKKCLKNCLGSLRDKPIILRSAGSTPFVFFNFHHK